MNKNILKTISIASSILFLSTFVVSATEGDYNKDLEREKEGSGIYFKDLVSPYKDKKPPFIDEEMPDMDELMSKVDSMKDSGEWGLTEMEINRGASGAKQAQEQNERKGGMSTDPGQRISDDVYKVAQAFGPILFPVKTNGVRCSSSFGSRNVKGGTKNHKGADLAGGSASHGSPIYAVADGVYAERTMPSFNTITISHKQGVYTRYLHASKVVPYKVGDQVKKGDIIGYVGGMGPSGAHTYGSHLHFEVHIKGINNGVYGDAVNPWVFIDPSAVGQSSGAGYGGFDQPSMSEIKSKRGNYGNEFK